MSFGTYNHNAGSSTKIPEKIPHFFMAVSLLFKGVHVRLVAYLSSYINRKLQLANLLKFRFSFENQ
jgi:hypothetical protein